MASIIRGRGTSSEQRTGTVKTHHSETLGRVTIPGAGLVSADDRCGFCGERRADYLTWWGDAVMCATCGAVYTPESLEE